MRHRVGLEHSDRQVDAKAVRQSHHLSDRVALAVVDDDVGAELACVREAGVGQVDHHDAHGREQLERVRAVLAGRFRPQLEDCRQLMQGARAFEAGEPQRLPFGEEQRDHRKAA